MRDPVRNCSALNCSEAAGAAMLRLSWRLIVCKASAFLLFGLLSCCPVAAEETRVYTDADLDNYSSEPMVDQETVSRLEDGLKSYKKRKSAEISLEKSRKKLPQAGDTPRQSKRKT